MSSTMLSQHIPDPDLITMYAENQATVFSRISPWTKLAALILVILVLTLTRNLVVCLLLYSVVLALYTAARLPFQKLVAWYALPVIFVISLVGLLIWTEPGTPLLTVTVSGLTLSLTDNGVVLALTLILKALISITISLFLLMTTRYHHLSAMAGRLFPSPLDQIFLMAYRFLFLTLAMTGSMLKAVRSRGGGLVHSIRVQSKLFAEVFALVFIRSFERAERVQKAMVSRGYSGTITAGTEVPNPRAGEIGVLVVFAAAIGVMVLFVPVPGGI